MVYEYAAVVYIVYLMKKVEIEHKTSQSEIDLLEVDISLLEYNLSLSPQERLINHQRALDTFNVLRKAGEVLNGESNSALEASS